MITFYLVRHGQTEWNRDKRMQGRQDSPLTQLGCAQALQAAAELSATAFDAAYVSPTGRARHTMEIILAQRDSQDTASEKKLTPVVHQGLAELGLGEWEGASYADDRDGKNPDPRRNHFWHAPHLFEAAELHAESFAEVSERALQALEEIAGIVQHGTVLVVSHTITIRSVLNHFLQIPLSDFWLEPSIPPCGVSELHWNNRSQAKVMRYGAKDYSAVGDTRDGTTCTGVSCGGMG